MARSAPFHQTSSRDHSPTWFWVLITVVLFLIIAWCAAGDYNQVYEDTRERTTQEPSKPAPVSN